MDQSEITTGAWAGLAVIATIACALLLLRDALRRRRHIRRANHAVSGERRAEKLLRRHGYRILAKQATAEIAPELDGEPVPVTLRADLLVRQRDLGYHS